MDVFSVHIRESTSDEWLGGKYLTGKFKHAIEKSKILSYAVDQVHPEKRCQA